jgi:hypothetical protein
MERSVQGQRPAEPWRRNPCGAGPSGSGGMKVVSSPDGAHGVGTVGFTAWSLSVTLKRGNVEKSE